MMRKILITEEERNHIMSLYERKKNLHISLLNEQSVDVGQWVQISNTKKLTQLTNQKPNLETLYYFSQEKNGMATLTDGKTKLFTLPISDLKSTVIQTDKNYSPQTSDASQLRAATSYRGAEIDPAPMEWCNKNGISYNCATNYCKSNPNNCKSTTLNGIFSAPKNTILVLKDSDIAKAISKGDLNEFVIASRNFLNDWGGIAVTIILDILTEGIAGLVLWGLIFIYDIWCVFQNPYPEGFSWGRLVYDGIVVALSGIAVGAKAFKSLEGMTLEQLLKVPNYKMKLIEFYKFMKNFTIDPFMKFLKQFSAKFPKLSELGTFFINKRNEFLQDLENKLFNTIGAEASQKITQKGLAKLEIDNLSNLVQPKDYSSPPP